MLYNDTLTYNQNAIRYSGLIYSPVVVISTQVDQEQNNSFTEPGLIYVIDSSEISFLTDQNGEIYSSESSVVFEDDSAEISFVVQGQ